MATFPIEFPAASTPADNAAPLPYPCKVLPLSYRGQEIPAEILRKCTGEIQLRLSERVRPGAAVQVETSAVTWLGEVRCVIPAGEGYAARIEIRHAVPTVREALPGSTIASSSHAAEEAGPVSLFLLKGMRLLAIKAEPADYRRFQSELGRLEERFRTAEPAEAHRLAVQALELLESHNRKAAEFFLTRVAEAEENLAMLSRATEKAPAPANAPPASRIGPGLSTRSR